MKNVILNHLYLSSDPSSGSITLASITAKNVENLKILNTVLLPVQYKDAFYNFLLENSEYSTYACYNDIIVGAVCCRLEPLNSIAKNKIYIMTFGVLAAYRRLGIGKRLLQFTFDLAEKIPTIDEIYLHVQEGNDAIDFYKKFGFLEDGIEENYYHQVKPSSAIKLITKIHLDKAKR